jgi:hypothetical protein
VYIFPSNRQSPRIPSVFEVMDVMDGCGEVDLFSQYDPQLHVCYKLGFDGYLKLLFSM